VVIGKVRVTECRPLTPSDRAAALFGPKPGYYGWLLEEAEEIPFVSFRGQQGLFNMPLIAEPGLNVLSAEKGTRIETMSAGVGMESIGDRLGRSAYGRNVPITASGVL
jgi:hypothetical protein